MSGFLDSSAIIISNLINRIHSNLYSGMVGSFPLLGLDKEYKKVKTLVGINCNDEQLNFFHPGYNPIRSCCR